MRAKMNGQVREPQAKNHSDLKEEDGQLQAVKPKSYLPLILITSGTR